MFAFTCQWNEEVIRFYQKKISKHMTICFAIPVILMMPFLAMLSLAISGNLYWFYGLGGACVVFVALVALLPFSRKVATSDLPQTIYEEEDVIYIVYPKRTDDTHSVEDVRWVIDHGTFYELKFRFGRLSPEALLQKDQITKGTIEEFEALFEDKLERRT